MILISGIFKSYKNISALSGVSLEVKPGSVTGLVGPNGCGKTTLIKSVLGLVIPDKGDIQVSGQSIKSGPLYRSAIGYMPQNPDFPSNLSIEELFFMLEDVHGKEAKSKGELITLFELGSHIKKTFSTLSGGTKQKVAAVAAFMFDAPILILDEPTVGLDPISSSRLKTLTKERAKNGAAVLLVSHIISEMEQLVDHMTFLLDGKVSFSGPTKEIMAKAEAENLEAAIVKLIGVPK